MVPINRIINSSGGIYIVCLVMIDSSGRLFLDLVPINRRSCGSLKVLVIINTISKQDVNVIDSKDVFINLVVINTISKDVNNVTITVIII